MDLWDWYLASDFLCVEVYVVVAPRWLCSGSCCGVFFGACGVWSPFWDLSVPDSGDAFGSLWGYFVCSQPSCISALVVWVLDNGFFGMRQFAWVLQLCLCMVCEFSRMWEG